MSPPRADVGPEGTPSPAEAHGRGLTLLKLGGSLITDKRGGGGVRVEVLARLAGEIARALPDLRGGLVLGHGSGSFGHTAAADAGFGRYGGHDGPGPDPPGVSRTQARARALHVRVADVLLEAGVAVLSLAPSSAAVLEEGRVRRFLGEPAALALERGLVPLVYGDVALERRGTAGICSTERALDALARRLERRGWRIRRALWVGRTAGVVDAGGGVLSEVSPREPGPALEAAGAAAGTDVTGGMAHRLEVALALARRGVESWIGDGTVPGRLEEALRGRGVPGTLVRPAGP